jgi:serine/threonine protein kinase
MQRAVTRTGSRDYMAPEVNVCPLKRTPADNKENPQMAYGAAVDVWSVGALAYELLVGFTPFPGGPPATRKGDPTKSLVFPSSVSNDARNFVLSCLEQAPGDRPTIQQLLRHRWLMGASGGADRGAVGPNESASSTTWCSGWHACWRSQGREQQTEDSACESVS